MNTEQDRENSMKTIYRILAALAVAGVLLAATVMVALSAK